MTTPSVQVVVDLRGLHKYVQLIKPSSRPMRVMLKQWAARYRGFTRQRYVVFSRGGGDWKPLQPSTIARKTRRGIGPVSSILIDHANMIAATRPGLTAREGWQEQQTPGQLSIVAGYQGASEIVKIAGYHQEGKGRLPVRKTIVVPNQSTLNGMRSDADRAMKKIQAETNVVN